VEHSEFLTEGKNSNEKRIKDVLNTQKVQKETIRALQNDPSLIQNMAKSLSGRKEFAETMAKIMRVEVNKKREKI